MIMGDRKKYHNFIGVFDSGVGGISVLRSLDARLPRENFLYFGDSANAPYGDKTSGEILRLSEVITDRMIREDGVKAVVIACNTATSAAAAYLRAKYPEIPIIGEEPAIKPAAEEHPGGRILIMATAATLKLEKFQKLYHRMEEDAEFITVSCSGLADRIEQGNLDAPDLADLLGTLIGRYRGQVDGVVLGCTHYPLIRKQILQVIGESVPLYDGGAGTARELERVLKERHLLTTSDSRGEVVFESSVDTEEEIDLYRKFFEMPPS